MQKFMTKVLGRLLPLEKEKRLLPSDQDHCQQLLSSTIDVKV